MWDVRNLAALVEPHSAGCEKQDQRLTAGPWLAAQQVMRNTSFKAESIS